MNRMTVSGVLAGLLVGSASMSAGVSAAQEGQAEQPVAIAVEDLPSIEDVMALHIEGIGGEEAVRSITSRRFVGRVRVFAQGQAEPLQTGRLEMMAKAPGTLVQDTIFPGQSSVRTVVQDGVVWQVDEEDNPIAVDEGSAARQRAAARFYQLADWETMFSDVRVVGGVSQGDRRAVQVQGTHVDDGRVEVFTFDLESGLLLLITGERPSPVNPQESVAFRRAYEDYREVEGVQYPHRVLEQAGPIIFEIEVSDIEVGVDVPTFDVPDLESEMTGDDDG